MCGFWAAFGMEPDADELPHQAPPHVVGAVSCEPIGGVSNEGLYDSSCKSARCWSYGRWSHQHCAV